MPDYYDRKGRPITEEEYLSLRSDYRKVVVGMTPLSYRGHRFKVSTVCLFMDMSFEKSEKPLLFETCIFGGPLDSCMERYATEEEAIAGHMRWVRASQSWLFITMHTLCERFGDWWQWLKWTWYSRPRRKAKVTT